MQRNDTARVDFTHTPNRPTPLQGSNLPESAITPESTNALGQLAIRHRKTAIVTAAAIVLITLFWITPTVATGLVFAGALFGINTLIDSRMAGGEK